MPAMDRPPARISCRVPLIGGIIRSSAVKVLARAAQDGDTEAIRTLSSALVESPHREIRAAARAALCTLSTPAAVDACCTCMLETGDPELLCIARECGYLPQNDEKKALFLFLSGKMTACQELDPLEGHPLLVKAILSATPKVRSRVLALARERGMVSLFLALGRHAEAIDWSPEDWRGRLLLHRQEGQWDEMFRLLFLAPLPIAVETVHSLAGSGWKPRDADRTLWRDLLSLVPDRWGFPDPPPTAGGTLAGQGGGVELAVISPDGQYSATVSYDGTLCHWSLPRGALFSSGRPAGGGITSLAYSPDGTALAIGGKDGKVRLVKPGDGTPIRELEGHRGPVVSLLFPRDSHTLVSGGADGVICSWQWPECREADSRQAHAGAVTALAAYGDLVASSGSDGTIRIMKGGDSGCRDLTGPGNTLLHLSFSRQGKNLTGVDGKGTVRVWNSDDGSLCQMWPSPGKRFTAWDATPDGNLGVLASGDHAVQVFSIPAGEECLRLEVPGQGISCLALHPEGTLLLAGCRDGYLHTWSIPDGTKRDMVKGHPDRVQILTVNQAGTGMVSAGREGSVRLRALPGGELLATMPGPGTGIDCLASTPGGEVLACGSEGGVVRVWDTGTMEPVHWQNLFASRIECLALHPSGTMAACGDPQGRISLWDLESGSLRATLEGHEGGVHALAVNRDGSLLASGGWDGAVRLWSLPGGTHISTLEGHASQVTSLAFSPCGAFLASGSHDRSAIVWDLESRKCHARLTGHTHVVSCLGISGDGRFLATGSWDRAVRVWSLPSGEPVETLLRHTGRVRSLAVHPDGSLLVSASDEGTLSLWTLPGGELIRTRRVRADARNGICLIPSKNLAAIASLNGSLRILGLPWTRALCHTTPADLSYVQSCITPELPLPDARQWKFLERLLAGRFRHTIGYGGAGMPAGPYDLEIVEEEEMAGIPQGVRVHAF